MARRVIDWAGIAAAYRTTPEAGPAIARRFGISPATLRRRARAEGWGVAKTPRDEPPSGDVLGGHRLVVAQGAALTLQLLDDLQAAAGEPVPEDGTEEGGLARAAVLQKRIAALRDLAAAARLWIALERQAWDLDKEEGKLRDGTALPDPAAILRLLDGEQRAQLRAIAERLADRPAGPAAGARPAR
ncbi:hypothetical protein [Methylobacterium nonmethylotrophicum]|uniref:HTH psq-type domain-containing protein n=1 Tax=Methylobacterium nonmethylotrophicum TaxID=1141884 RepID=A0A4Z0NKP3_9HYPH|nr:hypothetical protein [Methylobacterium nonmethylotrophicum]TGD96465.1 hypothetical protein EU555_23715 [Methylobacterium nonmethylotrophicum]